ncbi:hypothetical protein [Pseudogemmobacter blasticus]|uniref:Uncharacterized protein n=1 Tax=Fuscovulum blasticum DSM 2131 TaxID=1188250 RepID=A0A2T4J6Z2_FUSBL|nr:hypothetical protein [Fuscovulum blasticum]PTE13645.1 hypothetical protein C5F44_12650 [Fuscovulum blasticum DSM 2131]
MARLFRWIARAILLAVALLAAAILIFVLAPRFWLHEFPFMGETFTPEKWTEAGSCEGLTDYQCVMKESDCPRGPMVRSLLRRHLKAGTTLEAIVDLLGPAGHPEKDASGCMNWSLGMCSGLGIDYDSLFVCFDETDHLIKAGHVQH